MSAIIGAILRHILTIYGGAVAAGGDADIGILFTRLIESLAAGDRSTVIGTLVALAAVAWSIYDKQSKRKESP